MSSMYLAGGNIDILREISRWKIIPMKGLYEKNRFGMSYSMLCRKINTLETAGFVRCIFGAHRRKFLSLTSRGAEFCPHTVAFDESEDSLNHDLIATNVVSELMKYKNFLTGQVHCFGRGLDVEPDGIIFGQKNGKEYSLAIEVELHQKSKSRLVSKLNKYANSIYYSYVLYVINKESTLRAYKKILEPLNDEISRKVILLLDEDISPTSFNFEKSNCTFKGGDKKFEEIFG